MKSNPDVRDYVTASVALAEAKAAHAKAVENLGRLYEIHPRREVPQRPELDSPAVPNLPVVGSVSYALHGEQGGEVAAHDAGAVQAGGCDFADAGNCCGVEGCGGCVSGGCGGLT